VYDAKAMVYPRKEGMISSAAVSKSLFGDDMAGRLVKKALSFLANLCKGEPSLAQEKTSELSRVVEAECRTRARFLKQASSEEARSAVMAATLSMISRDRQYAQVYMRMLKSITIISLDGTKAPKAAKPSTLDEEDAAERANLLEVANNI
jgi:hypothetical protein